LLVFTADPATESRAKLAALCAAPHDYQRDAPVEVGPA
jgi:hypothetical protein